MIQVKLTKDGPRGKKDDVVLVTRNEAFGLTERGEGVVYKPEQPGVYKDRMMTNRMKTKPFIAKRIYRRKVIK